jgi:thioredoxin 1
MRNNWWKIAVVVALAVVVLAVIAGKDSGKTGKSASVPDIASEGVPSNADKSPERSAAENTPAVEEQQSAKPSEPDADTSKTNTSTAKQVASGAPAQKKSAQPAPEEKSPTAKKSPVKLPKLVDLGATKCIPCKMMAPILEELAKEYKGQLEVQFIDVWENQGEGEKYGVRSIPTQVFYDANGKEFFRHEGFYAKEDILAKFKEHGINLSK